MLVINRVIFTFSNVAYMCSVTQWYPTLCGPMDYSPPGFSVHGIFQARILEWVAIPFSRGSLNPDIKPRSTILQADSLPFEPPGKPNMIQGEAQSL